MDRNELGQIVDPEALSASAGARGRVRIEVPAAWLAEGSELELAAPTKIACDRCAGGGCDACGRSGALRAPETARAVRLQVPAGSTGGVALRIVRPFGDEAAIEQLIIEVRAGASPSPGVVRRTPAPSRALAQRAAEKSSPSAVAVRVALAFALLLAIAAALASR